MLRGKSGFRYFTLEGGGGIRVEDALALNLDGLTTCPFRCIATSNPAPVTRFFPVHRFLDPRFQAFLAFSPVQVMRGTAFDTKKVPGITLPALQPAGLTFVFTIFHVPDVEFLQELIFHVSAFAKYDLVVITDTRADFFFHFL
jgi:hypothetical protein